MVGTFTSDNRISCSSPAVLGACNLLVRATGKCFSNEHVVGPTSINTSTLGAITWQHEGRRLRVDGTSFLVLPHGGAFSLEIAERHPVSLACVYFRNGFVESVDAQLRARDLDPCPPASLDFLAHLHPRDAPIAGRIARLGKLGDCEADQLRLAEEFLLLARDLILLGRKTHRRLHELPAQKASTREELFRRVARGRDYLHSHALSGVSLEDLVREACVSTFHFHRTFTQLFGMTPHEYLTRIRMDAAAELLRNHHDLTVTEVADRVGFASSTSFSRLFVRRFSVSPLDFRRRPSV
jgi:AraC family transcriptional regulator